MPNKENSKPQEHERSAGIKGFLAFYVFMVVVQLIHGLILTGGSIIIYNVPSLAAKNNFHIPLAALYLYVVSNLVLAVLAIVLLVLIFKKKKLAITFGVLLSLLWPITLIVWHFAGEKSNFGTIVDTLPDVIGFFYILLSRRVRATLVN